MAIDVSTLEKNAGAFADCRGTSDERCVDAHDESEPQTRHGEQKTRNCLICKTQFASGWAGERICRRCKSTSAWRSGALG